MFSDTMNVLERMLDFLEIPYRAPETFSVPNKREYTGVSPCLLL